MVWTIEQMKDYDLIAIGFGSAMDKATERHRFVTRQI
jgi:hypothetical protein